MSAPKAAQNAMTGGPPTINWQVVGQQQTTQYNAAHQFVPGVNVTWQTDNGITGTTFVPQALYTLDNVLKAVSRHVMDMALVHAARGTVTLD